MTVDTPSAPTAPLLQLEDVQMHFPVREGLFLRSTRSCRAVDGVSLQLRAGETLGLVGESGCGKSTLGKCIVRLHQPTAGRILFEGTDLAALGQAALKPWRRHLQMVFQDPVESLNARHTVGEIVGEPFVIHGEGDARQRRERVLGLLEKVGLPAAAADRYPFEFSGGQRQRIGIARALALRPRLLVCDEPVSALDVSIQSQVLNLLLELQRELGLSYLFIAHNLAVVKHVSDRIAIMYLGRIVELAPADELYASPRHPYTRALLDSIPPLTGEKPRRLRAIPGTPPNLLNRPPGCAFAPRCAERFDRCSAEPALGAGPRASACFRVPA